MTDSCESPRVPSPRRFCQAHECDLHADDNDCYRHGRASDCPSVRVEREVELRRLTGNAEAEDE